MTDVQHQLAKGQQRTGFEKDTTIRGARQDTDSNTWEEIEKGPIASKGDAYDNIESYKSRFESGPGFGPGFRDWNKAIPFQSDSFKESAGEPVSAVVHGDRGIAAGLKEFGLAKEDSAQLDEACKTRTSEPLPQEEGWSKLKGKKAKKAKGGKQQKKQEDSGMEKDEAEEDEQEELEEDEEWDEGEQEEGEEKGESMRMSTLLDGWATSIAGPGWKERGMSFARRTSDKLRLPQVARKLRLDRAVDRMQPVVARAQTKLSDFSKSAGLDRLNQQLQTSKKIQRADRVLSHWLMDYKSSFSAFANQLMDQPMEQKLETGALFLVNVLLPLLFWDHREAYMVILTMGLSTIVQHIIYEATGRQLSPLINAAHLLHIPMLINLFFTPLLGMGRNESTTASLISWFFRRPYFHALWVRSVLMVNSICLTLDIARLKTFWEDKQTEEKQFGTRLTLNIPAGAPTLLVVPDSCLSGDAQLGDNITNISQASGSPGVLQAASWTAAMAQYEAGKGGKQQQQGGDIKEKAGEMKEQAKEKISDVKEDVKQKGREWKGEAKQAAKDIKQKGQKKWAQAKDKASDIAEDVEEQAPSAEELKDNAKQALSDLGDMAKEQWNSWKQHLPSMEQLQDGANRLAKRVQQQMPSKEQVKEKAQDVKEKVQDKAVDLKAAAAEKIEDVKEKLPSKQEMKQKANNLKIKAQDKAQDLKEVAQDKMQDVKQKASNMKEEAKDKAQDVKQQVKEKAADLKEKAVDVKEQAKDKAQEVSEKASDMKEHAKQKWVPKVEAAKEKAVDLKEQAKDKAVDLKEQAKDKVDDLKQAGQKKMDKAKSKAKDVKEQLPSKEELQEVAMDTAQQLTDKAKQKGKKMAKNVKEQVDDLSPADTKSEKFEVTVPLPAILEKEDNEQEALGEDQDVDMSQQYVIGDLPLLPPGSDAQEGKPVVYGKKTPPVKQQLGGADIHDDREGQHAEEHHDLHDQRGQFKAGKHRGSKRKQAGGNKKGNDDRKVESEEEDEFAPLDDQKHFEICL